MKQSFYALLARVRLMGAQVAPAARQSKARLAGAQVTHGHDAALSTGTRLVSVQGARQAQARLCVNAARLALAVLVALTALSVLALPHALAAAPEAPYHFDDARRGYSVDIPAALLIDGAPILQELTAEAEHQPARAADDGMLLLYAPPSLKQLINGIESMTQPTEEQIADAQAAIGRDLRLLSSILLYDEAKWDEWAAAGDSLEMITGCANSSELGRASGYVYVWAQQEADETGFEDVDLDDYRAAVALLPEVKASVKVSGKLSFSAAAFPTFSATDLEGNETTQAVFAENKLTMLNIWATFCGPCIDEMPYLGEISAAMPEGVRMIGLVGDATNDKNIKLAMEIVDKTGAKYTHIIPDNVLNAYIAQTVQGYPTTLFIDSEGNILGEPMLGAYPREAYEARLDELLSGMN